MKLEIISKHPVESGPLTRLLLIYGRNVVFQGDKPWNPFTLPI